MDWKKKVALVVVVVGVGLGVALQFRKPRGATSDASAAPTESAQSSSAFSAAANPNGAGNQAALLDDKKEGVPSAAANAGASAASQADDQHPSGPQSNMVDLNAPEQTHTIVDGDTLPKLAQQYLGNANRYMEIFENNRDVLRSPEVLPIGAELRIPSRLAAPSNTASDPPKNAPPATAADNKPLVPLVTPAAKPAAAQPTGPRTYTVQAGDNLVDIARKFYGDGRRNQDLYEANRRIMRNPGDLRAGMVLVVP